MLPMLRRLPKGNNNIIYIKLDDNSLQEGFFHGCMMFPLDAKD